MLSYFLLKLDENEKLSNHEKVEWVINEVEWVINGKVEWVINEVEWVIN